MSYIKVFLYLRTALISRPELFITFSTLRITKSQTRDSYSSPPIDSKNSVKILKREISFFLSKTKPFKKN
jgi:hypothetical protein